MKKANEIINKWKQHINNPRYITFNIQIDKDDFNEMVREIEELQNENERLRIGVDHSIYHLANEDITDKYVVDEIRMELVKLLLGGNESEL